VPSVSAVIVTWNSAADINACLGCCLSDNTVSEITVVDNASTDRTLAVIEASYPSVQLIKNNANLGFAAAANRGIKESAGDFILLINPDIRFGAGFVAALLNALESDPRAGAAAPKLLRPGGKILDSTGLVMQKNRKAIDRGSGEDDIGRYNREIEIFGACGAAGLFRRAMLEDVKTGDEYFDESFFSYKEDVDLAWRANLLGWRAVYVPSAAAVHERGWKTAGRKDIPRTVRRHSHKNRYLTIIKNDDPVNLVLHMPWVLAYEAKLFIYSMFIEPFLFLSFWDIIKLLPEAVKKRGAVMARRKTTPREIRRIIGRYQR